MDKREYLNQLRELDKRIKAMRKRIEDYRQLADSPKAISYGGVRVASSKNTSAPFERFVFAIIDLEEKANALQEKKEQIQLTIITAIEMLDREELKNLITLRYIEGLTWEQIGDTLGIVERTARRWHRQALEQLNLPI